MVVMMVLVWLASPKAQVGVLTLDAQNVPLSTVFADVIRLSRGHRA